MLSTHRSRTNTGEGNLVGQNGAGDRSDATSSAQVSVSATPTAPERRELAEAEIRRAADNAAATEAERYRSGHTAAGVGIGADATGTMYGQIGTGGGYRIDPDTLAAKMPAWEGMLEEIRGIRRNFLAAERLAQSPVGFPPADRQAEDTRKCARRGADHAQSVHDYIAGWIEAAKQAHGSYVAKEDDTAQVFSKSRAEDSSDDGTGSLYEQGAK